MDQMKKLMQLQKKAKKIQNQLANTHIEADEGDLTVIVNGKQEIVDIKIGESALANPKKLSQDLVKAANKGLKKSQEIAAQEMKEVMGDLGIGGEGGLPGLPG